MQIPWTVSWTSQHPIQRSILSEGPRTSSFSGPDEILPWKDMYELRYNSFNLYRSNMTLNLRNLNYPLLLLPGTTTSTCAYCSRITYISFCSIHWVFSSSSSDNPIH